MSKSNISGGLSFAAIVVAAMCLGTSVMQAGGFIADIIPDARQKIVMVVGIVSLLLGSQVLTRITGVCLAAKVPGWVVMMCLLTIGALEFVSISTSLLAFDGRLIEARRAQNIESPEYKLTMNTINNIQNQINQLSQDASNLPTNYVTKRSRINDKITRLQEKQAAASAGLVKIDVSTSGAAIDNLEGKTGISQTDIAMGVAFLLSALPICVNLAMGSLTRREKPRAVSGKKPQARAKLRAV